MDKLNELIEKGMEIKKAISQSRSKSAKESVKEEASIWKNQCVLYIDAMKVSSTIKSRFNLEAMNFIRRSDYDLYRMDEMLSILKALVPPKIESNITEVKQNTPKNNNIFIVHGHNKKLINEVKNVLYELGLKPTVLNEEPNGGKTIIEKFEEKSKEANYAIILMTADDEGKAKNEKEFNPRARQNVILEMGYFMSSLKRSNVFLLLDGEIELPSDIKGVGYSSINENWKLMLVKELRNCGYKVSADDLN